MTAGQIVNRILKVGKQMDESQLIQQSRDAEIKLCIGAGENDNNRQAESYYRALKGTVIEGTRIFQMKSKLWSGAENIERG